MFLAGSSWQMFWRAKRGQGSWSILKKNILKAKIFTKLVSSDAEETRIMSK